MKQIAPHTIKELSIHVKHVDPTHFTVYSPQGVLSSGFRKYFGWRVLMFGAWIMFGHRNEWMNYINGYKDETEGR